ncbi:MAG: tape measure protein [Candidatus Heimdallarchaeaceae archaeon]
MVDLMGAFGTGAGIAITIRAIDKFSSTFDKASFGIRRLSTAFKVGAVGVAAFGTSMIGLGVSSLRVAGDFEQTTIAFTTMMGSAEKAQGMLKDLAEFAKKTPFTLTGIETSARQLMAVGFNAEEILPVLKSVGDIAAGLGMKQEGLQRLILNLGQVRTQGKLTGRELRDFAVAGIPLLDELAKELGKTTTEISDMISAGKISSDVVIQVFRNMTSEGGRFEDLMAKQADTVQGKFSNLEDAWELMRREIGAALLPVVSTFADTLRDDLLPAIKPLIPVIGNFLARAAKRILDLFIKLVPPLIKFTEYIIEAADEIMELLMPVLEELIPILLDLGARVFKAVADAIIKLLPIFVELLEDVIIPIIPFIGDLVVGIIELVGQIVGFLVPAVVMIIKKMGEWIPIITGIISSIVDLINWIGDLIEWLGKIPVIGGILPEFERKKLTAPAIETLGEKGKPPEVVHLGGGGTTNIIHIEGNVTGTDPDEMADAFAERMDNVIRL